eukprot:c18381_g1_i1 orf=906-1427(-)
MAYALIQTDVALFSNKWSTDKHGICTALNRCSHVFCFSSSLKPHTQQLLLLLPPPAIALRLCRKGIRRRPPQSTQVCPNLCRERTQFSLGSSRRRNPFFSFRELARGFHISSGATRTYAAMSGRSPVLLFDVMGTIVRDPFYQDIPAFFGCLLCLIQGFTERAASDQASNCMD